MRRKLIFLRSGLMLAVLALLVPVTTVFAAGNTNPGVLPPVSHPYGKTYGEWSNAWYQWSLSLPVVLNHEEANPLFDTTGASCSVGQTGQVWFLAGIITVNTNPGAGIITRSCTVPAGKALFIPVVNVENDIPSDTSGCTTEQCVRDNMEGFMALAHDYSAKIDGVSVGNLESYRIGPNNSAFSITLPNNNLYQYFGLPVSPGTYFPAVSDGYYLFLAPMSAGRHNLEVKGSFGDFFSFDVTYILTIH